MLELLHVLLSSQEYFPNMSLMSCHFQFLNIMFILILFHPPPASTISFNFTHFEPGDGNILYEGDAKPLSGDIDLNRIDYSYRVGRASYALPVPMWEPSTGSLTDFTTRFSFTIDRVRPFKLGSGFAFFLAPVGYQIPPNSGGGFFAIFDGDSTRNFPTKTLVTVEFDTYVNRWDPNMTHVGINNNSISSSNYIQWDALAHVGMQANVWLSYNATSKNLSVFWSYDGEPTFGANFSLSYQIDLKQAVPEKVKIGFSASTGGHRQRTTIHSWEFFSTLEVKEKKTGKKIWIVIATGCFCFFAVGLVIGWLSLKEIRKRNIAEDEARISITKDLEKEAFPKRLSYEELVTATDNFSITRRLGQGGSGQVYLGNLGNSGCLVAVKRILAESELNKSIFINEVIVISRLKHRNLVQCIGWGHGKDELLLVYEYMQNGSLDYHLFGNQRPLPWSIRYKIAVGLATALRYLHEESEPYVLHRDIKSANVLLDTDFSAKLGDFGVAKLVDSWSQNLRTRVVGTVGYLAPEYLRDGEATKESDMFSFGVVTLEIACGRRADKEPLIKSVLELYRAGNVLRAMDKRLEKDSDWREIECLLTVGLWCTHPADKERPSARQVIQVLNFETTLPKLPWGLHDPVLLPGSSGSSSLGSHVSLDT